MKQATYAGADGKVTTSRKVLVHKVDGGAGASDWPRDHRRVEARVDDVDRSTANADAHCAGLVQV